MRIVRVGDKSGNGMTGVVGVVGVVGEGLGIQGWVEMGPVEDVRMVFQGGEEGGDGA